MGTRVLRMTIIDSEALAVATVSPLKSLNSNMGSQSPLQQQKMAPRVPQLNLMEKSLAAPAVSSRLQQLTARIDRDHSYDMQDQSARNLVMESKCKAVRTRIASAKDTQADRLRPMCELLARIGADIAEIVQKIDSSDKRLDGELHASQDRFQDEMEALSVDRAQAKARLNGRIRSACETLKKEFDTEKTWARQLIEKRHKKGAEKVFQVVDSLEGEHQNRARSDARTVSMIGKKHAAVDGSVMTERNARLGSQHELIEKIDVACGAFRLEHTQEKKLRHENTKNRMSGFRSAMAKLADNLDVLTQSRQVSLEEVQDKEMVQIEQLVRIISQQASVRTESESSMTCLLEDMHQKLHREIMHERQERQNTERVLMKLLEESVESIAIRADDKTLQQLKTMRTEREHARAARDVQMEQRSIHNSTSLGSPSRHSAHNSSGLQEQAAAED